MTNDQREKSELHLSLARRVHRFLLHYFLKLRGIGGGGILMAWLAGCFGMAIGGHGAIRILGIFLLLMFVAINVFVFYFYRDDSARQMGE